MGPQVYTSAPPPPTPPPPPLPPPYITAVGLLFNMLHFGTLPHNKNTCSGDIPCVNNWETIHKIEEIPEDQSSPEPLFSICYCGQCKANPPVVVTTSGKSCFRSASGLLQNNPSRDQLELKYWEWRKNIYYCSMFKLSESLYFGLLLCPYQALTVADKSVLL